MATKRHPVEFKFKTVDRATTGIRLFKREFRGLTKPIKSVNNQFQGLKKELRSITRLGTKAGNTLKSIGKGLTIGATLPIATAGFLSVKKFADLEQAAINVKKTTGLALTEINGFVNDISSRAPLTQAALFEIAGAAGQLGVKGRKNIANFTEVMGKLEKASDIVGEDGAKAIVRLLNVSGDGIGKMSQFSSALVDLGNNAAASESEILEMSKRVGLSTAQFKLGSQNILGISTAMKNVGINAEAGGTVIGKTFLKIQSALLKGGKSFKVLQKITGQSGDELKKRFKDNATGVFVSFISGLNRLKNEGIATSRALNAFGLTGDRVNAVIPTMSEKSKDLVKQLTRSKTAFKENKALAKEFKDQTESFNSSMTMLGNSVTKIQMKFGKALAPTIESIAKKLKSFADFIDKNPAFAKFLFWTTAIVGVLGPLVAGLGFLVTGFSFLLPYVAIFATKFSFVGGLLFKAIPVVLKLAGAFGTLLGWVASAVTMIASLPFAGVAAGLAVIAGAGVIIWKNFDKVLEVLKSILNLEFGKAFSGMGDIASNTFSGIKSFFGFGPSGEKLQGASGESPAAALGAKAVLRETVTLQKQQKDIRATVDFGNVPVGSKIKSNGFDESSIEFNRGQLMPELGAI